MFDLSTIYKPITAHPFLNNPMYGEYEPSAFFKPYINCFWGSSGAHIPIEGCIQPNHIIPDSCMDIIVEINHTNNEMKIFFSGMQLEPFRSEMVYLKRDVISTFAIRFHFWSAGLFLDFDPCDLNLLPVDMAAAYPEWQKFFETFFEIHSVYERIERTEKFLLQRFNEKKLNNNVMNGIYYILKNKGTFSVKDISRYACVSQRQLERLFVKNTGLSMKKLSGIVRYQCLWQDILLGCNIQDAVFKYHYTDQSHLLNNFKKYHGTTPSKAREISRRLI